MKIIFFGTPTFASTVLESIIKKNTVIATVTAPDKRKGRGKKIQESAVKKVSNENNITCFQPTNLKDEDFNKQIQKLKADLFIVIAFRMLPKLIWTIPKLGTINLHTSLLPNYRGAAPINWVIINGEKTTGITTFFINENIDQGKIILNKEIKLPKNITAAMLHNLLITHSKELINETIELFLNKNVISVSQENSQTIKIAPKLSKELCRINWSESINSINNKIQGLSPLLENNQILKDVSICPSAWFEIKIQNIIKRVKIQKSEITEIKNKNLKIDSDNISYLNINFDHHALSIQHLQIEGKNPMNIKQFLQGNKIDDSIEFL
ncbi:MAG: methionyl-tRNA formyltransferase [Flavobacteriales bacterium]|jgi:methionyl-tRNA formyltransferase|tara:strand:+ start:403 stop:1374 length:972 start_codon:yes stop_codon:yes gene_type:complete